MTASNSSPWPSNQPIGAAIGQYAIGEGPTGGAGNTPPDSFIGLFSLPVRTLIAPQMAIALMASGAFSTIGPPPALQWYSPFSEPVRIKPALPTPEQPFFMDEPYPEERAMPSWFAPFRDPVRVNPRNPAAEMPFLFYVGAATQNAPNNNFAEQTTYDKYSFALSEPVRVKPRLQEALQQFFNIDPLPVPVSRGMGWYANFSEPVRIKLGLRPELQQFFNIDPLPIPTTRGLRWYAPLSEPVKLPVGLRTELQQWYQQSVPGAPLSSTQIQGWWLNLALPVWRLGGIDAWLQQYEAMPPRLLPNPHITGTMAATETNDDVALIGVVVYDSVTPTANAQIANVSIIEISATAGGLGAIRGD